MTSSRTRILSFSTILATALLYGCEGPDVGGSDGGTAGFATGGGAIGGYGGEPATGGGYSTGGAPEATGGATGGAGPDCGGPQLPPQAYLCAGSVNEQQMLGFNWANLQAESKYYACGNDYYGTGGVSTGGAPGTGGWYEETGGGVGVGGAMPATGGDFGQGGAYEYPNPGTGGYGAADDVPGDIIPLSSGGAIGWGGVGGYEQTGGVGGYEQTGGVSAGGTSGGGVPGDSWCADATDDYIAGVSYAVGPCTQSQLRLPIRFQESDGWYTVRVFAGNSACERGTLIAETAGYGVAGTLVELPVQVDGNVFVSIELTSNNPWYGTSTAVQLLPMQEPPIGE